MGTIGKEERGFLLGIGSGGQHGMVAAGMEAKDDFGGGRFFDAQALGADGDATVAPHLEDGAHAPHVLPPRAAGRGAQDGAFFFFGLGPGRLRGLAQFAMDFPGVAMRPQGVDLRMGQSDFGDFFAGEIGGQTARPILMGAFNFAFGLGRGGVTETDVIKLECPAQLRERVRIMGEKDTVVIDVDLERASVGQESRGQEVEVGEQQFALINLGAGEQAAAIVQHVEHGPGKLGVREPAVGRGVELPEFPNLRAWPAPPGGRNFFGRDGMSQVVCQRPAADLGAVEFEVVEAQGFGSGEAVRTRRRAGQTFGEQLDHGLGPTGGRIATRSSGSPEGLRFAGAGGVVSGGQSVEAAAGESQLSAGLGRVHSVLPEAFQHMADEGRRVTMNQLLVFFKDGRGRQGKSCFARPATGINCRWQRLHDCARGFR